MSAHYEAPHNFLLQLPVLSSLLDLNMYPRTLFLSILRQCSSVNGTHQVSHPCKMTGKIIVVCILITLFLEENINI